jgi:replication factor A1
MATKTQTLTKPTFVKLADVKPGIHGYNTFVKIEEIKKE